VSITTLQEDLNWCLLDFWTPKSVEICDLLLVITASSQELAVPSHGCSVDVAIVAARAAPNQEICIIGLLDRVDLNELNVGVPFAFLVNCWLRWRLLDFCSWLFD